MSIMRWLGILVLAGVPVRAMADERVIAPAPQKVTITLSEYRYEPARVEVQSGRPVELHLVNSGKILHEFVSDALSNMTVDLEGNGVIALVPGIEELEVPPGAAAILRFTPRETGEFSFRCDAEDPVSHHESGMKGTLVVR